MKLCIKEKNGYPDNNFTEEEYMTYIKNIKKQLQDTIKDLDSLGRKQLEINEHGDYNSILTAEDEKDLYRRCALLSSARNFLEMCDFVKNR